jgi:hypothetical protein
MELKLLWSQDFETQESLNLDYWNYDLGDGSVAGIPGWGNQERENYTADSFSFSNGLDITASRYSPESAPDIYYGKAEWKSGKIHTADKVSFKFGRVEIIAKAPVGGGTWPAIWMLGDSLKLLGWPLCGEIDIFEGAGNRPFQLCGTLHGPGYSGDSGVGVAKEMPQHLSEDFHTYSIDWLPDQISWLVDGEIYSTLYRADVAPDQVNWPFNESFYLILNLAMGGWFAGDVVDGYDSAVFSIKSIKHFAIDGVGEIRLI